MRPFRDAWRFLLLAVLLCSCSRSGDVKIIKLAHGLETTHPVHKAMVFMVETALDLSAGKLRIDIYPSEQLGTERENIELLQLGSLGMTKVSASVLESFIPIFKVFGLPYLFENDEHRFRVLEGPIGQKLLQSSGPQLLRGLSYYDAGSRSFYTRDRAIRTPADLRGLKIRVMQSATAVKMVNMLGGSATPIAMGELYGALQQGVVDGAENNHPSFYSTRHYEICKFLSIDEHTSVPDVLVIGLPVWESLTDQQKGWLTEAVAASYQYQKTLWSRASQHALAEMKKAGVQVTRPDKALFEQKVSRLYDEYREDAEVYQLIQQIKRVP